MADDHHDFRAQRYSALEPAPVERKNLKLALRARSVGTSIDEYLQLTPARRRGFMYVGASWGSSPKVYCVRASAVQIVWQMTPCREADRNRGVALWNNLVISQTGFAPVVRDLQRHWQGSCGSTKSLDQCGLELTAAPARA